MSPKKCMFVGSLLVMAAQTAIAVTCDSITTNLATICAQPNYTGDLITNADATDCASATAACDTGDAAVCCVPKANCRTLSASNCAGGSFTGALKPDDDNNRCERATCDATDVGVCCISKAFCDTASAGTICTDPVKYVGAIIGDAPTTECAGNPCDINDAPTCCAPKEDRLDGDDDNNDDDDDDDDDDKKFSNTCTAPKRQCESGDYVSGFKGGCHSCDEGPESCAELLSIIKKGGCYAECAVGWSQNQVSRYYEKDSPVDCKAGEIEKALGRKTAAELEKEIDAVGCGTKERYCGPAEQGGMMKDYIPEFEGGCSSCEEGPADCEELIDFITTGCHADCSVGMTPEAVAEMMKSFSCTEAETKKAQDAVALEQKAMLNAGDTLLVNGFSLAALAAAAVFSAVC